MQVQFAFAQFAFAQFAQYFFYSIGNQQIRNATGQIGQIGQKQIGNLAYESG